MIVDPFDDLLERLATGDVEAAEEVYREYEPCLRLVVRRQLPNRLRAKFDSADVVQSVWVKVLDHLRRSKCSFPTADHLRAFLVKSTRNRLIDRVRQNRAAAAVERPLETPNSERMPASREPRPSEEAQADDLWMQMLAACPAAYHPLLELKRQGLPLAEVAQRTGMHVDSVRRILRKLARRFSVPSRATGRAAGAYHPVAGGPVASGPVASGPVASG
ncbi:MAG TPA: sigma-70 family RNA polymerase sigma factor, partial [Pirellulales bacterium]|nr:sigma-70 family RNA polymerase sigma factor [Pirellulales bacterium]